MKQSTRIKQLFQIPSYRTRLGLFLTIGGLLVLISLVAPLDPKWQNVGTNVATTFIGVGLVSYLWEFLGGDPVETKIVESMNKLEVVFDVAKSDIGMERIWSSRRRWAGDTNDGSQEWRERLCQARNISIVSMTFWSWFDDDAFIKDFFRNVSRGARVNFLIYDPTSDVLALRAKDERDPQSNSRFQMQNEIIGTLRKISEALIKLPPHERDFLDVRLSNKSYHLAQIIKADDRILVSTYLAGKSGSSSPTFQLKEPSHYFSTYVEQIDILWNKARPVNCSELLALAGSN